MTFVFVVVVEKPKNVMMWPDTRNRKLHNFDIYCFDSFVGIIEKNSNLRIVFDIIFCRYLDAKLDFCC